MGEAEQQGQAEQGVDLIGLLFSRLENAAISIGRVQTINQFAMEKLNVEVREVKQNAELQQEYLLEQLTAANERADGLEVEAQDLRASYVKAINAVADLQNEVEDVRADYIRAVNTGLSYEGDCDA